MQCAKNATIIRILLGEEGPAIYCLLRFFCLISP